jgi:hypothetical protein
VVDAARRLMANGHIKPLSNYKQFAGNTQQGLASKALAGTMREITSSLSRPWTRLVTRQDSGIGEQSFEHGSDLLIDGEGPISCPSLCYVAPENRSPAPCADLRGQRHITIGATLRIKCGAPHLMREICMSGLTSGDWKRSNGPNQ